MELLNIIGDQKSAQILVYFLEKPSIEIQQTQLIKETKTSKTTTIRCIKKLLKQNILTEKKIGNVNILKLNNNNFIVKEIKKLNILTQINDIKKIKKEKTEIYLYGSCARGEQYEDSDIDLLMIGDVKRNEIIDQIQELSQKIKREINFKIFKQTEWAQMQNKDKPYYERVEKDKIEIE